ncbi:hypothetical protein ACIPUD_38570 [Bradyrhizobium sp. CAR08]
MNNTLSQPASTPTLSTHSEERTEIVALGWQDLCGITRVRGLPLKDLEAKAATGLGFPACGQALTVSGGIAPNRWGPIDDVRQIPALDTLVRVPRIGDYPGLNVVLADSIDGQGQAFACCTRSLFKDALRRLSDTTGLEFAASFEHEFTLSKPGFQPELCMTLDALQALGALPSVLVTALDRAGIVCEAFEPEFGSGQYELSVGHDWGVAAADKAVLTREIIRDVSRHFGYRASFCPKIAPSAAGNGAHIHFSLRDKNGNPVLFDPARPNALSALGGSFAAGVIRHINSIMCFASSTPVGYMRIGPGKWSSGYNAFGLANREAVLRICDLQMTPEPKRQRSYNLEFRAADNAGNPYLVLAMIVRAGLQGIVEKLQSPPSISVDPAKLDEAERMRHGIKPLPSSLDEALQHLDRDEVARSWLPDALYETFVTLKRKEISATDGLTPEDLCARYARIF